MAPAHHVRWSGRSDHCQLASACGGHNQPSIAILLLGAIKTRYQGSHHRRIPGGEVPAVAVVGVALVGLLGHFGLEGLAAREPGLQLGA